MDLQELRQQIDEVDEKLVYLFQQRMDISTEIARYKQQHGMPVYDPAREEQILERISRKADDSCKSGIFALYSLLFELSRAQQERVLNPEVV